MNKTVGKDWFDMKPPEITTKIKEGLQAIQLRDIIDPAKFIKKIDRQEVPKFFKIGTIIDNILDVNKNRMKNSPVELIFSLVELIFAQWNLKKVEVKSLVAKSFLNRIL